MLRPGSRGEAVRDLQRAARRAGPRRSRRSRPARSAPRPSAVVRAFQEARGLRVDGICGPETWAALVESGFALGDRLLYRPPADAARRRRRRAPAPAQRARLRRRPRGRHPRRRHRRARCVEFQRNVGLAADGICGAGDDRRARPGRRPWPSGSVASVREREALRRGPAPARGPPRLRRRRARVRDAGAARWSRELVESGAGAALDATGADDPVLAAEANRYAADLFLAVRAGDAPGLPVQLLRVGPLPVRGRATRSPTRSAPSSAPVLAGDGDAACGRTYAVLRETRMAAVVCEPVGARRRRRHARARRARAPTSPRAIVRGVRRGVEQPPDVDARPELAAARRAASSSSAGARRR